MERNQLKYVVEVARQQNITRAAETLHVAQPSLSAQIINLERELGVSLFERSKKRVYLTEAGATFVHQAEHILNDMKTLEETMKEFANKERGRVRIGMLPIMTALGMVDMIAEFSERYPKLELNIVELGSNALLDKVRINELDAAIAILTEDMIDDQIKAVQLLEAGVVAAIPSGHRLSGRKLLTVSDLGGERFVLMSGNYNMQRLVLDKLQGQGIPYSVFSECNQIETCFYLCRKGFGITFCSEEMQRHYACEELSFIPFKGISKRKIYLLYSKDPAYHPALRCLLDFVREKYS